MIKEVSQKAADHITALSYSAGGGTAMFGYLKLNDIALIVGIVLAVCTFIVNWVYREKHFQLAKAQHENKEEHF